MEILLAWEQWPGPSKEFYRALGVSQTGMASIIGRAKRLRREGHFPIEDFKEIKIEQVPPAGDYTGGLCKIELTWEGKQVIRFALVDQLIDFLKNDPQYGGCAVMLGVPTHFRELNVDCLSDSYLHDVMAKADIIMPWMVGRFSALKPGYLEQYGLNVKADIMWCNERHLDYVPCIYPGFSWYNLGKVESHGNAPLNQIPRQKGAFYWSEISRSIQSGANMFYVAMFDEMDEGTAIFKCSNTPPVGPQLCDYEGLPTDHYLWLTGQAGKMLRKEIPFSQSIPSLKLTGK